MQRPGHIRRSAFPGALLISIILAPLAVASAQPAKANSPVPNAQPGTNPGPAIDFVSKARTNNRPGITSTLPQTKEEVEPFSSLKKRAEQGNARAQFSLGLCYYWGTSVPQDYAEAAKWYRKAAEQGNADAQCSLGVCYGVGYGVGMDQAEAATWYRKAAEQGNSLAQYNLGVCYAEGQGVDTDLAEAVKWYRKAADQGSASAQYNLGVCYARGQGVQKDQAEAARWYRRAAEQGSPLAQYNLGVCYAEGQGVGKDYTEAVRWWRKAAVQGDAQAQCSLAVCCYLGEGMTKDYVEAAKWFRKAAEQGDAFGQVSLAICYEEGNGVARDYAEAATWYRKAAEQGNPLAQYSLGVCYSEGQGVERDFDEAVKWYRKAAEQGNAHAQVSLAFCYEDGISVPKDDIEAYKWFELAAAQGGAGGARWRDLLAAQMTKDQIAEALRRASLFVPKSESPDNPRAANPSPTSPNEPAPRSSGSGFFVTEDGCLATCFHVIAGASRIVVRTEKGSLQATLLNADKANDVALLKVNGRFSALPIAPSRAAKLGEAVFTIGFPTLDLQGFAPKAAQGEITGLTGSQNDPREFQISAPVQPRNSGGPLVNQYGNVVGLIQANPADSANPKNPPAPPRSANYALKSSVLSMLLESLPEVSSKLKEPYPAKERKLEDVVKETKSSTALVLAY